MDALIGVEKNGGSIAARLVQDTNAVALCEMLHDNEWRRGLPDELIGDASMDFESYTDFQATARQMSDLYAIYDTEGISHWVVFRYVDGDWKQLSVARVAWEKRMEEEARIYRSTHPMLLLNEGVYDTSVLKVMAAYVDDMRHSCRAMKVQAKDFRRWVNPDFPARIEALHKELKAFETALKEESQAAEIRYGIAYAEADSDIEALRNGDY